VADVDANEELLSWAMEFKLDSLYSYAHSRANRSALSWLNEPKLFRELPASEFKE